ncbi:L-arabinose isomerase [Serratia fonticola]|uniref:L-arabinose isomerase n=1 Tax=Serratia fonticola TaxID=47917 RepID=A0A4U9WE12_SERFO|nr:L-arabinose isomerase [Serratia fonticola]
MRQVAVTDGDKVAAQIQFGYSVDAYGIGDLVSVIDEVSKGDIDTLVEEYEASYELSDVAKVNGAKRQNLIDAAAIELGMKRFLEQGKFHAFTTNFETLHGMKQLPGLAVQRLMQQGYGFAGEGDWKTAALLRIMKVMGSGLTAALRLWRTTPTTSSRATIWWWVPTCWRSALPLAKEHKPLLGYSISGHPVARPIRPA